MEISHILKRCRYMVKSSLHLNFPLRPHSPSRLVTTGSTGHKSSTVSYRASTTATGISVSHSFPQRAHKPGVLTLLVLQHMHRGVMRSSHSLAYPHLALASHREPSCCMSISRNPFREYTTGARLPFGMSGSWPQRALSLLSYCLMMSRFVR